jgi:hypothetical protein
MVCAREQTYMVCNERMQSRSRTTPACYGFAFPVGLDSFLLTTTRTEIMAAAMKIIIIIIIIIKKHLLGF